MINLEPDPTVPVPPAPKAEEFVEEKLDGPPPPPRAWEVAYYHSYFDVSTATVRLRLTKAIYPFLSGDFFDAHGADLYAPLWICFTLVFLFTAGGTFAVYEESVEEIKWVENLQKVTVALLLFFGLLFVIPTLGRFLLKSEESKPVFADLVSIYGYSLTIYLPGAILCLFPIHLGRIIVLTLCGVWASFVLFHSYLKQFSTGGAKRLVVGGAVLLGHIAIVLAGTIYFF
jgi:hypothetical protein